ncbi:MAG TPA: MJ0042-type zinc finger domain-containing protein [Gemmataceae bacterium]|jgi:predicted Zn finger-like uncharacterized protein|nr:MJ0042-type zinc finger domain-containing protein [Gemmataceae bacterium]
MFYIQCPECGAPVEIDPSSIGPDRTDPWNVEYCFTCGTSFDYDDAEVVQGPEPQAQ